MTRPALPATKILEWYDRHGRELPWRSRWPKLTPAYHVWLSEIMLQQTVVKTVIPYFAEFTRRWPDVCSLAAAPHEDVMAAWAGLGYYARARNLHRAASIICNEHGGEFPKQESELRELPGIGTYTSAAITAFAFGGEAVVIDANIERVLARYFALPDPPVRAKRVFADAYLSIRPTERPSDFPQAMMDFAGAVCQPKSPQCGECPLASGCAANKTADPLAWPVNVRKRGCLAVCWLFPLLGGQRMMRRLTRTHRFPAHPSRRTGRWRQGPSITALPRGLMRGGWIWWELIWRKLVLQKPIRRDNGAPSSRMSCPR